MTIKTIKDNVYLVNGKEVNTLIPVWGRNLTSKEYRELQKYRFKLSCIKNNKYG